MFKTMFVALVLMVTATVVSAQEPTEQEICISGANIAEATAKIRDQGATQQDAYFVLVSYGLSPELAQSFVVLVYFLHAEDNPTEVYADFMNECLGQGT